MANRDDLQVGGYFFGSYEDATLAKREMKNAQYLNERVDSMSGKQVLAIYDKMLDEKMFKTPVGWEYLKFLRGRLVEEGVEEELIRPIPIYATFSTTNKDNNDYSHIAKMHVKNRKAMIPELKGKLRTSVWINIFLVLLVIILFVITFNSSNPNILNYKQAVIDEYASWEQELTERENAVKEKENSLKGY